MSEPVDRFCDALAAFESEEDRVNLVGYCRYALGVEQSRSVALNPNVPIDEALRRGELEDLREHMRRLVGDGRMAEEFLIPALFFFLKERYLAFTDPARVAARVDDDLAAVKDYREQLAKPFEQREFQSVDDDGLRYLISTHEESIRTVRERKDEALVILSQLEEIQKTTFSDRYWKGWFYRQARAWRERSKEPG